jgi:hypothetical protein
MLDLGQAAQVLPLVSQLYSKQDENRAEALAVTGLLLLTNDQKDQAERALDQALQLYPKKKPVPLRSAVVTLAMALKKDPPKAGKEPGAAEERHIGEAGGLARQGQWDQARQQAQSDQYGPKIRLRALLAVARAAVDGKAGAADVEAAVGMAQNEMAAVQQNEPDAAEREKIAWELFNLVRLGLHAGMEGERLTGLPRVIADPGMRGWAQLELLRPRLKPGGPGADEAALDQVEHRALAYRLARLDLARYNTRRDSSWAKTVQSWEGPERAFGWLGVALGLEDRDKGA